MGGEKGASGSRSKGGASAATGKEPEEMTKAEADFQDKWLKDALKGLPIAEALKIRKALRKYQEEEYMDINGALRGKEYFQTKQTLEYIADIKKAMKLSKGLTRPTTLVRGIGGSTANRLQGIKVGEHFSDDGFVSTSFNSKVHKGSGFAGKTVIVRIRAPKGTKGVPMHKGLAGSSILKGEGEFLLNSGAKFRVTSKKTNSKGQTILNVRLTK